MSRPRPKARSRKPKFHTLRSLISAYAEGLIEPQEMNRILDGIEMGIGLDKRDRAIAKHLETAPTLEEHPAYLAGFDAGTKAATDAVANDKADVS